MKKFTLILLEKDYDQFYKEFLKLSHEEKIPLPCTKIVEKFYIDAKINEVEWSELYGVKIINFNLVDIEDLIDWIDNMRARFSARYT